MIPLASIASLKGLKAFGVLALRAAPFLIVTGLIFGSGAWAGATWQSGREANARAALSAESAAHAVQAAADARALAACRDADADAARAQTTRMIETVEANTAATVDAARTSQAVADAARSLRETPRVIPHRPDCLADADDVQRFGRLYDAAAAGAGDPLRDAPGGD